MSRHQVHLCLERIFNGIILHVDINSGQSAAKDKKREKLLSEISPAQVGRHR